MVTPGKEHRIGSLLPAAWGSHLHALQRRVIGPLAEVTLSAAFLRDTLPSVREQVVSGETGNPWEASLHRHSPLLPRVSGEYGWLVSDTEYLPEARMESPCSKEMLLPGATVPSPWQGTLQSLAQTSIPRGKAHSLDIAPNPAAVAHTWPALLWGHYRM